MKVSIIIPVHNSILYLKKCVDSCLNQTLDEVEIILVDDASSDDSPKLIEEYEMAYPDKIRTIYLKENLRQGGARNHGIMMAKGEYICFVDSDDWIEKEMCEKLYNVAVLNNADMAGGDFYISENNNDKPVFLEYNTTCFFEGNRENNIYKYLSKNGLFWTRIYKREFLVNNKIFFPENIFYEDAYFNFTTAFYANKVVKITGCFYHYYQSPNSTVRIRNNERLYDKIKIAKFTIESFIERGLYSDYRNLIDYRLISMSATNIVYICFDSFDKPSIDKLKEICFNIKEFAPRYKNNPYYKNISLDLKFYLNITMFSPKLATWCYKHNFSLLIYYMDIIKKKYISKK